MSMGVLQTNASIIFLKGGSSRIPRLSSNAFRRPRSATSKSLPGAESLKVSKPLVQNSLGEGGAEGLHAHSWEGQDRQEGSTLTPGVNVFAKEKPGGGLHAHPSIFGT